MGRPCSTGFYQAGCLKARFPRGAVRGWSDVVTLNTSGGIAGGDRLTSTFEIAAGARATIASQAAERYYRVPAGGGPALVRTRISVGDDAAAEWLPQETILFDGCAIDRRLDIELSDSSWFVGVETLVFGRAAMGERVRTGQIRDVIRVRRAERLIWHDAVRMDGDIDALLRRPGCRERRRGGGDPGACRARGRAARRCGARRAGRRAGGERRQRDGTGCWSRGCWRPAPRRLRQAVTAALGALREGRPLPRVWLC